MLSIIIYAIKLLLFHFEIHYLQQLICGNYQVDLKIQLAVRTQIRVYNRTIHYLMLH